MRLYSHYRSSASYRVRIALNLKGIAYEIVPVDLGKREQRTAEYLAVNPQGLVPALDTGDGIITQSSSILEWLEETHPEPPLLPRDPAERARVRSMAALVGSDVHPLQNRRVLSYLKHEFKIDQEPLYAWARHWMAAGFDTLERVIGQTPGCYSYGAAPTLADVYLAPQLYNARMYGLDLAPYPNILSVERECAKLEAFAAAHPDRQPDAPGAPPA